MKEEAEDGEIQAGLRRLHRSGPLALHGMQVPLPRRRGASPSALLPGGKAIPTPFLSSRPTPEACKSHEPLSPSSHTFQSSSFLYSKTRDVSTGSRQARSPFSFLSSLPRESIFLNLILPETIWMKTAQEIQSGTKPSALIHLALSQPSASALKNPYSSGCHGPPGHRSKPCLHAEPHLPDISGTVNHLAVFSSSHPLSGPLVPLCSATNCNVQRSNVVQREKFTEAQGWKLSLLCDFGQVT